VVGMVLSMQQQTTNHIYVINDGYGLLEARRWVGSTGNTEAEMEKWSGIQLVVLNQCVSSVWISLMISCTLTERESMSESVAS